MQTAVDSLQLIILTAGIGLVFIVQTGVGFQEAVAYLTANG